MVSPAVAFFLSISGPCRRSRFQRVEPAAETDVEYTVTLRLILLKIGVLIKSSEIAREKHGVTGLVCV